MTEPPRTQPPDSGPAPGGRTPRPLNSAGRPLDRSGRPIGGAEQVSGPSAGAAARPPDDAPGERRARARAGGGEGHGRARRAEGGEAAGGADWERLWRSRTGREDAEDPAAHWERLRSARFEGGEQGPSPASPPAGPGLSSLVALVEALRALAPRELERQFTALLREALLTLRALIDWYLERLDSSRAERRVEDIPID